MHPRSAFLSSFLMLALLTPPAGRAEPPRRDSYGDPLPKGAVFRIGTTRLRSASNDRPFAHLLFSPDGKFVFSSAGDGQDVCMWEIATGREVRRFAANRFPAPALAIHGSLLAASNGREIDLYDAATGKKQRHIELPEGIVTPSFALTFSSDGKALLLRHWDRQRENRNGLSRWDIATGKQIGSWTMGADAPVALSADKRLVAALHANDSRISIWDAASGKKIREWQGAEKTPLQDGCLIFSPDGRSLASVGADAVIREYETATGKEVRSWKVPKRRPYFSIHYQSSDGVDIDRLAFTADGKTLASVDQDTNALILWDWKTGRELHHFEGVLGPVVFSPDGKIVAAGGNDRRIRLWDTASGRDLCPFADAGSVTNLGFASDGRVLAVGSNEPQVRLLDAGSGRLLKRYPHYRSLEFSADDTNLLVERRDGSYCLVDAGAGKERGSFAGYSLGWNPHTKRLVTFADGSVRVWDTATGLELRHFGIAQKKDHPPRAVASADARTVALMDESASIIHLFSTDTGKELRQLKDFSQRVNYQAERGSKGMGTTAYLFPQFSPRGTMLLAGIDLNSFGLWDAATGKWILRLRSEQFVSHNPILSPNGDLLCLLDRQADPCLVDAATGRVRHRLAWKGGDLFWILQSVNQAFSVDGRLLAAAYDPQTLVLWETATGRPIRTWPGHGRGQMRQMIFAPDSRRLATMGGDDTALVWDVMGLSADGSLPARKLAPAEAKQAWTDLGDAEASKGHRAIWMLVADPPRALPLLRQRLHPARGTDSHRLAKLIADLDSDDFAVRDTATRELKKIGAAAQSALGAALKGKPALELRRRVQGLLDDLDDAPLSAETLRGLRAVAVLEYMDSGESRQLLGDLAAGAPEARLTHEAKEALTRLHSRKSEPRR